MNTGSGNFGKKMMKTDRTGDKYTRQQKILYLVMFLGLILASQNMVLFGALLFSAVLLFQIVTLPVEFDASNRAKALLSSQGIIAANEKVGVNKVLNSAAMTYVAAVVSTLMTLLYFLLRAGLLGGRND